MMDWLFELSDTTNVAMMTDVPYLLILVKMLCAVCAGGAIGFERSFHGRPVGIRTYCLVCLASVALAQVLLHVTMWLTGAPMDLYRADRSRQMQAVSDGIAFLCAGIILREGLSVHGLTTSASIWATSMIGLLFGIGFFYVGALATVLVVAILSVLRVTEWFVPTAKYAYCNVVFDRDGSVTREVFFKLLNACRLEAIGNINQRLINGGHDYELEMTIRSRIPDAFSRLSKALRQETAYKVYRIQFTRN